VAEPRMKCTRAISPTGRVCAHLVGTRCRYLARRVKRFNMLPPNAREASEQSTGNWLRRPVVVMLCHSDRCSISAATACPGRLTPLQPGHHDHPPPAPRLNRARKLSAWPEGPNIKLSRASFLATGDL